MVQLFHKSPQEVGIKDIGSLGKKIKRKWVGKRETEKLEGKLGENET